MLSETTYEVQYVTSDGALRRKSIVHRNRLKGVRSQEQKDILAEAKQRQEAALSGQLEVSDEPEADDAGSQRGSSNIRYADGSMSEGNRFRNVDDGVSSGSPQGRGGSSSSDSAPDRNTGRFYRGSDEDNDAGEWTTVCRQRKG